MDVIHWPSPFVQTYPVTHHAGRPDARLHLWLSYALFVSVI